MIVPFKIQEIATRRENLPCLTQYFEKYFVPKRITVVFDDEIDKKIREFQAKTMKKIYT